MTAEAADAVSIGAHGAAIAAATGHCAGGEQRLAVAVFRLLSAGEPVSVRAAAAAAGTPESAAGQVLRSWPAVFWDGQDRVTGFWGLALAGMPRSKAGYRLYPPEAVADLRFIARAKALGLSLEQIRVLRAPPAAQAGRRQLRHVLAHRLVRIRRQRQQLEALEDALARLFAGAAGEGAAPPELPAAALAGEMARIEAAVWRCGCALDPGCTCGCPCCSLDRLAAETGRPGREGDE